ncbi:Lrp/AsnC family transcriptional regulator [Pseudomonas sp. 102515]|nr:Lrp/AsnC family transcriptional regulator [Pseudomonas sp. 102515]MDQ7914258.1 Lrp/AsnC family transcriptional regulator [Pseudomonas sp. 102515]
MFTRLDPTDWQLIHMLRQNARISYVTLAHQLGVAHHRGDLLGAA